MSQTAIQNANTITFGSGKMEVSPYGGGGYVNLGALRNIVFEETWTEKRIISDNAGVIKNSISEHRAALAGDLMEIDLTNLNLIRGGIDTYDTVAGTPVAGYNQTVLSGAWLYNKFIPLTFQMGTGAMIVVTSVTGATDGALVVAVDYDNILVNGVSGIIVKDSVTVTTEAQNLTIVYDYTPAASKSLSSGGKYTITPVAVKVTNTNEAGEDFIIEVYKAANAQGITLNLQPDESGDPNMISIRLNGDLDVAKAAGNQLFKIISSQL
ncbi:MAG: hypothetical protein L0956_04415 [Candidatus Mariimomonas ferrooxydans]